MQGIWGDGDCAPTAMASSMIWSAQDHGKELVVAAARLPLPSLSGAAGLVDSGDELGQTGREVSEAEASRARRAGFCQCVVSRFHSTGACPLALQPLELFSVVFFSFAILQ